MEIIGYFDVLARHDDRSSGGADAKSVVGIQVVASIGVNGSKAHQAVVVRDKIGYQEGEVGRSGAFEGARTMRHRAHLRQKLVQPEKLLRQHALLPVDVRAAGEVPHAVARPSERAAAHRVHNPNLTYSAEVLDTNAHAEV